MFIYEIGQVVICQPFQCLKLILCAKFICIPEIDLITSRCCFRTMNINHDLQSVSASHADSVPHQRPAAQIPNNIAELTSTESVRFKIRVFFKKTPPYFVYSFASILSRFPFLSRIFICFISICTTTLFACNFHFIVL